MATDTVYTPRGDFNEGVFYPKTFSEEQKNVIKTDSGMYWMALEIFTKLQGRVLISGYQPETQTIQLATREGFYFGITFKEWVDAAPQYHFRGVTALKDRGRDKHIISSKKVSYLTKKVREAAEQNLDYVYTQQTAQLHSLFHQLNNEILTTRHITADLTGAEEAAALMALYSNDGLHAITPQMEGSLKKKYMSLTERYATHAREVQECKEIFPNGAWLIGICDENVLVGDCQITYNEIEKIFETATVNLRQYASFNDVENEIHEPLKLNLVMLKAHMKSDGRIYAYVSHDEDRLFPITDKGYKEYGASMYCTMTNPIKERRQWMVIAK
jgi:hypothetical protein